MLLGVYRRAPPRVGWSLLRSNDLVSKYLSSGKHVNEERSSTCN